MRDKYDRLFEILIGGMIIIIFLLLLSLSGCVWFLGETAVLGYGKKEIKYADDGKTVREIKLESKPIISDLIKVGTFDE